MKYTISQQSALDLIADIHEKRIAERASLRRRIEQQLQGQLIDLEIRESRAANDALTLGISRTAVGRACGTSNWGTITALLARTAGQVTAADIAAANTPERFTSITDDPKLGFRRIKVTMAGEDWDAFKAANKQRSRRENLWGLNEATFVINEGQAFYRNTTDSMAYDDHSTPNKFDHPVAAWIKHGPGKDEVAAWLAEHDDDENEGE